MPIVPPVVSGAITIALIVVLGLFVYPMLLARPLGKQLVAIATVLLAALFYVFEYSSGSAFGRSVVAIVFALAPLLAGTLVHRLQRGNKS
jgi:hypothetical protein